MVTLQGWNWSVVKGEIDPFNCYLDWKGININYLLYHLLLVIELSPIGEVFLLINSSYQLF